ncbi:MAG: sigma-54 dependent transcriptional regulator [Verrucomicrobiales bacterium]|nr:sigma-54 dependent transcriptional regulator [Verrucomicrobiales bacterium]
MKSVLIVEDDPELGEMVADILIGEGLDVDIATNGAEGLAAFKNRNFSLVLTDFRLPEMGGIELLAAIRKETKQLPVVIMTAHSTTRLAIEATRKGAFDYLIKPFKTKDLIDVVNRALEASRFTARKVELGVDAERVDRDAIIGNARAMQLVYREIGKIADKNVTVLIQGETGTGKELVARAVYQHSRRSNEPFIAVNCSAIPENLLESELFGHEKGSFTGAATARIGRFEQANEGTLFLDEIGDMTLETQVKMLRVLQEKKIRRVGGDQEIPVDVRVLAATHQNLEEAVAEGKFREDLYFRINAALIDLPPLRKREGDINMLIQHFTSLCCRETGIEPPRFEQGVLEVLENYNWPGNVRELENFIRKMIIKSNGFPITLEDVRKVLARTSLASKPELDGKDFKYGSHIDAILLAAKSGEISKPYAYLIEELEREIIARSLIHCEGNQSKPRSFIRI